MRRGFWDGLWVTLLVAALVGFGEALLPAVPAVQLVVVPAWLTYWLMTRKWRLGVWVAIWGGLLLEASWRLPAGCVILFLLGVCGACWAWREALPREVGALHGLLMGVLFGPLFRVWVWAYSVVWLWEEAGVLRPTFAGFFVMPATGALGGGLVFAVARWADFLVLRPEPEEGLGDGG